MLGNPFQAAGGKRYYTYDSYLKKTFGGKVCKVPLDGGFTCPNRDGRCGYGGCSYCSGRGSGDFAPSRLLSLTEQYAISQKAVEEKWRPKGYIPYLQAYTNTYGPPERLRALYEEALALPGAVGLSIATRADCLEKETVALLRELHERTHLTVELGLQTIHDRTAARIGRGHNFEAFLRGYEKLSGLRVTVHLIDYLPGESREEMCESARAVAALAPHGVKFHMLYVAKGTAIEREYRAGNFSLPERAEYVATLCDQLERLPSSVVIERLTGDAPREALVAPLWTADKRSLLNAIDKELIKRNSYQGKFVDNRQKND